jgi:hypothetical protein
MVRSWLQPPGELGLILKSEIGSCRLSANGETRLRQGKRGVSSVRDTDSRLSNS